MFHPKSQNVYLYDPEFPLPIRVERLFNLEVSHAGADEMEWEEDEDSRGGNPLTFKPPTKNHLSQNNIYGIFNGFLSVFF